MSTYFLPQIALFKNYRNLIIMNLKMQIKKKYEPIKSNNKTIHHSRFNFIICRSDTRSTGNLMRQMFTKTEDTHQTSDQSSDGEASGVLERTTRQIRWGKEVQG